MPEITAPRRSSRLQQKGDEAYKREIRAGCSTRQRLADGVPRFLRDSLSVYAFNPHIDLRDQTAHKLLTPPLYLSDDRTTYKPLEKGQSRKRRRTELPNEGNRIGLASSPYLDNDLGHKIREKQSQTRDQVGYWAANAHWPPDFAHMPPKSKTGATKRSGSLSYTASYRSGDVPAPHSAASADQLLIHGINLGLEPARKNISETDRKLCDKMLSKSHQYIPSSSFPLTKLSSVLDELSTRGEGRIVRDLSPLLVPSPENLVFSDALTAPGITEDVMEPWKAVPTMGGPMPKPDLTVGIRRSQFQDIELAKLQNYKSWDHATLFTNHIYFPFLICEVKCSDRPIDQAMRQGGHAGAIAANAVFQLFYTIGRDKAEELNGTILAFTVIHDHDTVKIFGCFPVLESAQERPNFYQYLIHQVSFRQDPSETKSVRDFVLEIYSSWYPSHLKRITDALQEMRIPSTQPMDGPDNQESMPPPTASANRMLRDQITEVSSANRMLQDQIAELLSQLRVQQDISKAEREEAKAQREEAEQRYRAEREEAKAQREEAEQRYRAEREEAKAQREEAEQRYKAEREEAKAQREEAEQRYRAEREEAEQRYRLQQRLLERLITGAAHETG